MSHPTPTPAPSDADTRTRLLEVAGELFAEQGYRAATVRELCTRAGANGAAVHYHFGDKATLYRAVVEHAFRVAVTRFPPDLGVRPGASAEERLEAFVRSFLLRLLSDGVPAWLGKIMAREMIEPTDALEHIIGNTARPLFERLTGIVRELAGPDASVEHVMRCSQSVVGQCLFYRHCREMIRRGWPESEPTIEGLDELARHITRFSLAGIRAPRAGGRA
ncbi:MAG: CerR family C-terminal domain-containing protein [Planctomycetes bacterium]|nr:CerR family C-terminal domain-containing protein [Planctomycetota bacterium]